MGEEKKNKKVKTKHTFVACAIESFSKNKVKSIL